MAPKISVCRRSDDILLTIEGGCDSESFQEVLSVVRQLLVRLLRCAAPGSPLTYSFKTRGKIDLEKMAHFQQMTNDQPCGREACGNIQEKQEHGGAPLQGEAPNRQPRGGLILLKGGAV